MDILCFLAGTIFFYTKNSLSLLFLFATLFIRPHFRWLLAFAFAIVWGMCHQYFVDDKGMPNKSIIKRAQLDGFITSTPIISPNKTQFKISIDRLNNKPVKANILMFCYKNCHEVKIGEYWHITAKLRKPHNLSNLGGFDYVGWLNTRHLQWVGVSLNAMLKPDLNKIKPYRLETLRQMMATRISLLGLNEETLGILQALSLGFTTHIDKPHWDLFRRTGTTHLMVISGAHIGLVAGLFYSLVTRIWCRLKRMCLLIPAPKAASIVSIFVALFYALLAGFAVPAQRSLLSTVFLLLRYFFNHSFSAWQAWRYALLAVILWEPHAVMMAGFYLSFLAVAILIVMNKRISDTGIKKTFLMQLACLFGLMPLTLYWFSYGAVNGFFANLLAIPWIGFVIVPLSLLTTLIGSWCAIPWVTVALKYSIALLIYYLNWIDSSSWLNITITYSQVIFPIALIIAMCVLIFIPIYRLLLVCLILTYFGLFPRQDKIKHGEAIVDILDVGQGLSVFVRTTSHNLIYDTGIEFYKGTDMGKLVIIPYLNTLGMSKIDAIVISHPDLDHRGGLKSLEEKYTKHKLIVDNPNFYKRGLSCHDYPDWEWDGVSFHFFKIIDNLKQKNNSSCVLQIKSHKQQILLTGDIEKPAEKYLVANYGASLKSSVIVVPHHGSKSSSTPLFLKHVNPKYAIFSYGFDNRYNFPHRKIIELYNAMGISIFNTMDNGMIRVTLGKKELSILSNVHVT